MNLVSLFSGCGGLDLGFKKAGFNVKWAVENAPSVWKTYEENHADTHLIKSNIQFVKSKDLTGNIVGIIGGPPCQSWSIAGLAKGLKDRRGQLFFEFIRVLRDKQPLFFLAENVPGILLNKHKDAFNRIKDHFIEAGYNLSMVKAKASDFGVPQDRERVFFIGYRGDMGFNFQPPMPEKQRVTVREAIWDLRNTAIPGLPENRATNACLFPNHEYWQSGYSYIFMSRNRVLDWDAPSFTIQAEGRQVSIHPQAPKMEKVKKDVMRFAEGKEGLYRRLTIRECARLQTFPDDFIFYYDSLNTGYKMVGNAVPVNLAWAFAKKIREDIQLHLNNIIYKRSINGTACEVNTALTPQMSALV